MNGEYRPVKGYEEFYLVNNQGDIIALRNKNGKSRLKPYLDKDGYHRVRLKGKDKSVWIGVHKVVAMAFLPNPNNYYMVNHKNFKRDDNRVENLEWCSAKYNAKYSINHYKGAGFKPIIKIDDMGNSQKYKSISEASRITGVSAGNICRCLKNRTKKAGGYIWKYETY